MLSFWRMTLDATLEWIATSDIDSFIQRTKSNRFEGTAQFSTGMKRILVAGIGNIFSEMTHSAAKSRRNWSNDLCPTALTVRDFGIRSYDLAYAMMDDYDATILIDASPRGETPGTIYLIQPEINIEPTKINWTKELMR